MVRVMIAGEDIGEFQRLDSVSDGRGGGVKTPIYQRPAESGTGMELVKMKMSSCVLPTLKLP